MNWLAPLVSRVSWRVPAWTAREIPVSPPAAASLTTLTPLDRAVSWLSLSKRRLSGISPRARSLHSVSRALLNYNLSFLTISPVDPADTAVLFCTQGCCTN